MLDYSKDGIAAIDLGVIGESQFALSVIGRTKADVWRRKASEVGTYGGWRWECGSHHAVQYAAINPELAEAVKSVSL